MKKLYRSKKQRVLTGVCGGLAEYLNKDPNIVRLVYVLLTLITHVFPLLIVYILAAWLLPEKGNRNVVNGKVI